MSLATLKMLHEVWASITVLDDKSYSNFMSIISDFVAQAATHEETKLISSANIMVIPHRKDGKLATFRIAICSHVDFEPGDILAAHSPR